jgi:cytochrome c-type biogenesis protein CcmH/NrfG
MPVPSSGAPGRVPRPVVFSPPLPRNADGQAQETPERSRSRQHFQRGVTLLGQGNFDDAEEAFRDAIALCSEEHVYLIGLARALYYNPSYTAQGKVPVLRSIVDRAGQLAPDDGRVLTLTDWVRHAEASAR